MVKDGWYYCKCGKKLFKVKEDTLLLNFPTYCPKCKREDVISLITKPLKSYEPTFLNNEYQIFKQHEAGGFRIIECNSMPENVIVTIASN